MSNTLFDDIFKVEDVDAARYNRVSRIEATSTTSPDIKITLDINSDLYPVKKDEVLTITLASSLSLDDDMKVDARTESWRPPKAGDKSLADDYDYVMFGTVYKFEETSSDKTSVYVSFGGLLLCLEGNYRSLSNLKQDSIYLLIRK
ncbi:hypothetical protein WICPIJ_002768 [Wickerhamomyces pijperi]|uniref:DNA-directed RNA polymerases I, II, and III subunit RPABC3 n=1 Tax=Wickerhamomyces pijperi TaxID=599730 RepID=A0A9P8TPW1_WICPI|nr:hypothetical protein WICPIJ_002768 [Wickerhamomyces pijperi]